MFEGYPLNRNAFVTRVGKFDWWKAPLSPSWYRFLRFNDGKPNPVAVCLLSEVINRYQPIKGTDENDEMVPWRKRFPGQWLKLDYERLTTKYGFSKRQFEDAAAMLRAKGLAETHVMLVHEDKMWSSVSYIEPQLSEIEKISLCINPEDREFTDCQFQPGRVHKYDKHGEEVIDSSDHHNANSFNGIDPDPKEEGTSHLLSSGGPHLLSSVPYIEIKENKEMKLINNNNARADAREEPVVVVGSLALEKAPLEIPEEADNLSDSLPSILSSERPSASSSSLQLVRPILPEGAQSLLAWTIEYHPDAVRYLDYTRETMIALADAYDFDLLTACYKTLPKGRIRNWRSVQQVIAQFSEDSAYVQNLLGNLREEGRDEVMALSGIEWPEWVCEQAEWLRVYAQRVELFCVQEFREGLAAEWQKRAIASSLLSLSEIARWVEAFAVNWQLRLYAPEIERLVAYGLTPKKANELALFNIQAVREKLDFVEADRDSGRNKILSPAGWLIPAIQENWMLTAPVLQSAKRNPDLYVGEHVESVPMTYTPEQNEAYMAYLRRYEEYVRGNFPEAWVSFEQAVVEWEESGLFCKGLSPEDQWASNLITFFSLYEKVDLLGVRSMDEWLADNP